MKSTSPDNVRSHESADNSNYDHGRIKGAASILQLKSKYHETPPCHIPQRLSVKVRGISMQDVRLHGQPARVLHRRPPPNVHHHLMDSAVGRRPRGRILRLQLSPPEVDAVGKVCQLLLLTRRKMGQKLTTNAGVHGEWGKTHAPARCSSHAATSHSCWPAAFGDNTTLLLAGH